jgi:hypothetical protein
LNLRAKILYDARLAPHNVLLIERTQMPLASDARLQIWVVRDVPWKTLRWSERLDEALMLLAGGQQAETPVVAHWALWQVMPLVDHLAKACDTFVEACKRARGVKPDGQT